MANHTTIHAAIHEVGGEGDAFVTESIDELWEQLDRKIVKPFLGAGADEFITEQELEVIRKAAEPEERVRAYFAYVESRDYDERLFMGEVKLGRLRAAEAS